MPLAAATRLGPYEVLSPLGAGGMGEVYRARDTKLNRDVALKILPQEFAADADRLARFKREAQLLASLNHPNIAQIYGFEDSGSTHALVLELVEGPTLADLIQAQGQGPKAQGSDPSLGPGPVARGLPVSEALPMARQIADALEAAHDLGIIHRDLKPANVKVRDDGTVKVLDFGLAKALDPAASFSPADAVNSPTLTAHSTQLGVIIGTAAYMAPEQARGRAVDRRADVWAFGAVLYEMLTGRRAFEGDDVSVTLAAVLKDDVSWAPLPAAVPAGVRSLMRRCLEKDPKRRLQAIGEARVQIDDVLSGRPADPGSMPAGTSPAGLPRTRGVQWSTALVALAIGGALTAAGFWWVTRRAVPPSAPPVRFAFSPSLNQPFRLSQFDRVVTTSPDGRHVVVQLATNDRPLAVRSVDQVELTFLAGTEGARAPFVSPDSKWVAFFGGASTAGLRKVPIGGGAVSNISRSAPGGPRGADWGPDDVIIFATNDAKDGLMSVPAGGGDPKVLTTPDREAGELDHFFPVVLPGAKGVLFTIVQIGASTAQVAVLDRETNKYKVLIRGGSGAAYVASPDGRRDGGFLVYGAAGTARAVRFDLARLEVVGESIPVIDKVAMVSSGAPQLSVSANGTLAYLPGTFVPEGMNALAWVDRQGRETPVAGAPVRGYYTVRLSPDGARMALDVRDQERDIWIWENARQTLSRMTVGSQADGFPVWSPNGERIAFASQRTGPYHVFWQKPDGTGAAEDLLGANLANIPSSFTPDGRRLIVQELGDKPKLGVFDFGPSRAFAPLFQQPFSYRNGEISPDGRWLAYESDESGRFDVYVRPFPDVDARRVQVSTAGGMKPAWAANGREIFYVDAESFLTAVPVQAGLSFETGAPARLFPAPNPNGLVYGRYYDVAPDGRRFVIIRETPENQAVSAMANVIVVTNWYEELKTKFNR